MNTPEKIKSIERYLGPVSAAKRFGINKGTWWRWRTGRMKPTKAHLTRINRSLAGFKAHGTPRREYRTTVRKPSYTATMHEYNHPMTGTVDGNPQRPRTRKEIRQGIRMYIETATKTKDFRKAYKRLFDRMNAKTHSQYENSLTLLVIHDFHGELPDGIKEDKAGDVMASMSLIPQMFKNYEDALNEQREDVINTFDRYLKYYKYIRISFKTASVKTYRYA